MFALGPCAASRHTRPLAGSKPHRIRHEAAPCPPVSVLVPFCPPSSRLETRHGRPEHSFLPGGTSPCGTGTLGGTQRRSRCGPCRWCELRGCSRGCSPARPRALPGAAAHAPARGARRARSSTAAPAGEGRLCHGPGQPVTFRLTPHPDRRWHADWLCSRYAGPCLVSAGDEDGARGLATRHFRSGEVHIFHGDPWRRRDLVIVEAGGRLPPLPYGMVVPMLGRLGE
jgi:hypothetical protein